MGLVTMVMRCINHLHVAVQQVAVLHAGAARHAVVLAVVVLAHVLVKRLAGFLAVTAVALTHHGLGLHVATSVADYRTGSAVSVLVGYYYGGGSLVVLTLAVGCCTCRHGCHHHHCCESDALHYVHSLHNFAFLIVSTNFIY